MRSKLFILVSLILVFLIKAPLVQGDVVTSTNGGFAFGLTDWTIDGNVSLENGIAVLNAAGSAESEFTTLYQGTGVIPPSSIINFDLGFKSNQQYTPPGSGAYDFFNVTFEDSIGPSGDIYFIYINNIVGPYNYPSGSLTDLLSGDAPLLYHFSMNISELEGREGTLFFALYNDYDGYDSIAYVDNVSITPAAVPEPATLLLLGSGLVGVLGFARRRRSQDKL